MQPSRGSRTNRHHGAEFRGGALIAIPNLVLDEVPIILTAPYHMQPLKIKIIDPDHCLLGSV